MILQDIPIAGIEADLSHFRFSEICHGSRGSMEPLFLNNRDVCGLLQTWFDFCDFEAVYNEPLTLTKSLKMCEAGDEQFNFRLPVVTLGSDVLSHKFVATLSEMGWKLF